MAEIITFYSYKGGTGRSMALANVAWILASRKKRVLAIDWDLEAPGLHRYFAPFLVDRDLTASRGVIDFIRDFAVRAATPVQGDKDNPQWYLPLADILDYAVSIRWPYFAPGMLDFIPAGQQDAAYATRVNSFSWETFYDKLGGGAFLEAMKKIVRDQYDYVLIDSRTGVSDTSGICTVQMPDSVVVCFTLNNQSIKGASSVARSIAMQRTDASGKSRVRILPVATRVDTFEKRKLDRRRAYAKTAFGSFLEHLPPSYWNDVEVPYWSFYAYEECLAAFGDEPGAPNSLLRSFEGIASHVSNGEVKELLPPPAEERERVLAAFEETPALDEVKQPEISATPATAVIAHDLYLSSHYLEDGEANTLSSLLEGRRLYGVISARSAMHDERWADAIRTLLRNSRAFAFCEGRYGLSSWQKREIAFALEHQRQEAAVGRKFPVVPILLPQSNPSTDEGAWLYLHALDLRRRIDDAPALDAFARALLGNNLPGIPDKFNPWKGSAAYGEKDAPLYFGRDEEVRALAKLAGKSGLLFVSGASGSGKTSFINAGLLPVLRRQAAPEPTWEIVRFRPESNPFHSLIRELVSLWSLEANETGRTLEVTGLVSRISGGTPLHSILNLAFERPPRPSRLMMVVDHAEDVFLRSPKELWEPFFQNLHAATEHTPTTVLIAIRPEWEDALRHVMPSWNWLLKTPFRLKPLTADRVEEVLAEAAAAGGRSDLVPAMTEIAMREFGEPGGLAIASRALHGFWSSGQVASPERLYGETLDAFLSEVPELQRLTLLSTLSRLVEVPQNAA